MMEIKTVAFLFICLYILVSSNSAASIDSNEGDSGMQNDDYGNYEDIEEMNEKKSATVNKSLDIDLNIITQPQNFTMNIGETVTLPCEITGSDFVRVWRKKDVVLFQSEIKMAATPNMNVINGSLEITNLHVKDAGEYECDALGTSQKLPKIQHNVRVRLPPHIDLLEAKQNKTILKVGETLTLLCKASGYPEPKITWHKGPHRFTDGAGETLTIEKIKHHDAGIYKCLADNNVGEPAFKHINIKVEHKPVVIVEKVTVSSEHKSEVELECQVHAEPRAVVVWMKDNREIANSNRIQLTNNDYNHNLLLKDLQESDFGEYVCSAKNSLGAAAKKIRLVATPAIHKFDQEQLPGNDIGLVWEIQSKSKPVQFDSYIKKQGETNWKPVEVKPNLVDVSGDIYQVKYVLSEGLARGKYDVKFRTMNNKGWSEEKEDTLTVGEVSSSSSITSRKFLIGILSILILRIQFF